MLHYKTLSNEHIKNALQKHDRVLKVWQIFTVADVRCALGLSRIWNIKKDSRGKHNSMVGILVCVL